MRRPLLFTILALLFGAAASGAYRFVSAADPVSIARHASDVVLSRDAELLSGVVRAGTNVAQLLDGLGMSATDSAALIEAIGGAFDVRRLRAGQHYEVDQLNDGRVRQFLYE